MKSLPEEELAKYTVFKTQLFNQLRELVDRLDYQYQIGKPNPELPVMLGEMQTLLAEMEKLTIGLGLLSGLTQKQLGEIHRLSPSRVCQIIKELRTRSETTKEVSVTNRQMHFSDAIISQITLPYPGEGNWTMETLSRKEADRIAKSGEGEILYFPTVKSFCTRALPNLDGVNQQKVLVNLKVLAGSFPLSLGSIDQFCGIRIDPRNNQYKIFCFSSVIY